MTPYYDDGMVTIYHGDMREVLGDLLMADGFRFAAILTDPPYGIGLPYGEHVDSWRPDRETWRLLTVQAPSLHMTVSNRHLDYWIEETKAGGWEYLHTSVYWNDTRCGGNWNGQFAYAWEPMLSFKLPQVPFRLEKRMMTDVFQHDGYRETIHPAERALGVWENFMSHLPDGTILDPFMGSGTTLRAALNLGRSAVGIEREERWCEAAALRCQQASIFVS